MEYNKIFVTNHAIERFFERINSDKFKKEDLSINIKMKRREIENQIRNLVLSGSPDRSFLNDKIFLGKMYDKYGYDNKIDFIYSAECNLVFLLLIERNNVCKVITTLSKKMAKIKNLKFSHIQKKSL